MSTQVLKAVPVAANQIDVEFNVDMEINAYLIDPELYLVSGGLVVRGGPLCDR